MIINTFYHNIGAEVSIARSQELPTDLVVSIINLKDTRDLTGKPINKGSFYDFTTKKFSVDTVGVPLPYNPGLHNQNFVSVISDIVSFTFALDKGIKEAVVRVTKTSTSEVFYEKHVFGKEMSKSPNMCEIFGNLLDVSGNPLPGQPVEAFLNRAGFYTHESGTIGAAARTITDSAGYFSLLLVQGLDVTISVPAINYTFRGYVPNESRVELTTSALLTFKA